MPKVELFNPVPKSWVDARSIRSILSLNPSIRLFIGRIGSGRTADCVLPMPNDPIKEALDAVIPDKKCLLVILILCSFFFTAVNGKKRSFKPSLI